MYYTRQGDVPAEWASKLLESHFQVKVLGTLEAGLESAKFTPSSRESTLKGYVRENFAGLKTKLTVAVATKNDAVVTTAAGLDLVMPLGRKVTLPGHGGVAGAPGAALDYDLSLGISVREALGKSQLELFRQGTAARKSDAFTAGGAAGVRYHAPGASVEATGKALQGPEGLGYEFWMGLNFDL